MFAFPATLPDDPAALQQMLLAALAEIERQRLIIAALQRNRFGRRSEQLGDEAVQRGGEDLEQSVAEQTAALDAAASRSGRRSRTLRRVPSRPNAIAARCRRNCRGSSR